MAKKKKSNIIDKFFVYRVATMLIIAALLIQTGIVSSTFGKKDISLYFVALLVALPLTTLLDKYIVKLAKK